MARYPQSSSLFVLAGLLATSSAFAESPALSLPATQVDGQVLEPAETDLHKSQSTASRLGLSALETPASTTSLSGDTLRERNARSAQDAVTRTPGLSFIGTPGDGGTGLSARGFTGHASVMQLFDGIRLYTGMGTTTFPTDPWQLEGIEVLRGPASSLYGEGATGAVINYLSKTPFEGEIRNQVRLGYGSYDRSQFALDSGGSLSDSLSYRATVNRQATQGWVDRGDARSLSLGAALRWQASDDLAFTLAHDQGDLEPGSYFGTPLINGRYRESLREKNYNLRNAEQHYNDQWTRLTTDWTLSDQVSASNQLYYLKSRRYWRNAEAYTWDDSREDMLRSDYLRIKHHQQQIGDRQTFTFDHSLLGLASRTLVGTEVNRIRFDLTNNSPYNDIGGDYIDPWNPAPGYYQSASAYRPHSRSQTRTFALFAENQLQLSERWSLITGARRDQVHIDRDDLRAGTRSDRSLSGGNWRAGLVYALTPNASLYGQYGTSKDGVNNLISLNPTQQQMDLTEARQTELGFKQQFWEGRGQWTVAGYHIVKEKLLTTDPVTRVAEQIGQQSADGIEASLELSLARGWQVSANASVVRAEYDEFYQGGVSRAGNRPVDVPRRTANLWVNKALPGNVRAGAGLRYVDDRYADTANQIEVPGYTVADANLSWRATPQLTLGLELNNLFDRQYAVSQTNSGQQWFLGEPRSFFVTTDITF
ncbi:TonB-dependent siderophore receptor [Pseudomonas sp. D(2018)]|uniref:TonB-dependent receptor n=1 Tax=Pseudomonas sp. D(2018) TaxID=2502238 RepID=UPI0010F59DA1|nr:TonB-dependent receptor [Pseudomonas sp. D(2018)]